MGTGSIRIDTKPRETVNYALQVNEVPLIPYVKIKNNSGLPLEGAVLRVSSDPAFTLPFSHPLDAILPGEEYSLKPVPVLLTASYLASITESAVSNLSVSVLTGGEIIAARDFGIRLLAFDECSNHPADAAFQAAYVMPSTPVVLTIVRRATSILSEWEKNPSMSGYQQKNRQAVMDAASAVFEAVRRLRISYCIHTEVGESKGHQRIRLPDEILRVGMGNCIELSLLFASCLEACGLNPVILTLTDHAMAGVWLNQGMQRNAVTHDLSAVLSHMAGDEEELLLFEATLATDGKSAGFADAVLSARKTLEDRSKDFVRMLDVHRARTSGIRPMPTRIVEGEQVVVEEPAPRKAWGGHLAQREEVDIGALREGEVTRFTRWGRKLLDLTVRNPLLNAKEDSKWLLRVLCPDNDALLSALAPGTEMLLIEKPDEYDNDQRDFILSETLTGSNPLARVLANDLSAGNIRSIHSEKELKAKAGRIIKGAAMVREESGSAALYAAVGLLHWHDGEKEFDAPVLLSPVEMHVEGKGVRIRVQEAFRVNETLLEMLLQKFNVRVRENPAPDTKGGQRGPSWSLAILRETVRDIPGLELRHGAFVGVYAFDRMPLYRDLQLSHERISGHPIAGALERGGSLFGLKLPDCDERPEEKLLVPLPADASQLRAVDAAMKGGSFVLHGPPGTGKSQTLSNIIANAMAADMKSLFISEKEAAARIVMERMAQIGLAPFCLMAHSPSMQVQDLLSSLMQAVNAEPPQDAPAGAEQARAEVAELRAKIEILKRNLHGGRGFGMSLYRLLTEYLAVSDADNCVTLDAGLVRKMNGAFLEDCHKKLDALEAAAEAAHPVDGNPLHGIGCRDYAPGLRESAEANLRNYADSLLATTKAVSDFGQEACLECDDHDKLIMSAKAVCTLHTLASGVFPDGSVFQKARDALEVLEAGDALSKSRITLVYNAGKDVDGLDGIELNRAWKEAGASASVAARLKRKAVRLQLHPYENLKRLNDARLSSFLAVLDEHCRLRNKFESLRASASPSVLALPKGKLTTVYRLAEMLRTLHTPAEGEYLCDLAVRGGDAVTKAEAAAAAADYAEAKGKDIALLLEASPTFGSSQRIRECLEAARHWLSDGALDGLKAWCQWNAAAQAARELGLDSAVKAYAGGLPGADVKRSFHRAAYGMLLSKVLHDPKNAGAFSGDEFARLVREYAGKYEQYIAFSKHAIRKAVYEKLRETLRECADPRSPLHQEMAVLTRANAAGGRGYTLRSVLSKMPVLLRLLKPCILMSPVTAAQVLNPQTPDFELLVYDEASQIPTCRSVMTLSRGKTVIIAGDPLQMPPSNLFSMLPIDEDHPEAEDLESILDDCLAVSLPEIRLGWHYRSSHESLIAFSNSAFYHNAIHTFPSADDRCSRVVLIKTGGIYDRGKTRQNRMEAEQVVAEAMRRLQANDSRSMGIITFNVDQAALIQQLLEKGLHDNGLREFSENLGGGLQIFVKSIEFVQGDERDVILLSVGYGPDRQGRYHMTFGPLSVRGGHRRLNVALTRSRDEMVVFSSMPAEEITLSETTGEGVRALRQFLRYAESTELPNATADPAGAGDSLTAMIAEEIRKLGYDCRLAVGRSAYKVDIAVCDPQDSSRYILGIQAHGLSYAMNPAIFDREVGHFNMLRDRGWRMMRVWPADWFEDKSRETCRIRTELEKATAAGR